jgi:hypothetical protein
MARDLALLSEVFDARVGRPSLAQRAELSTLLEKLS